MTTWSPGVSIPYTAAEEVLTVGERFVNVECRDDGVAVVRLDRPKMNALSTELLGQLGEAAPS